MAELLPGFISLEDQKLRQLAADNPEIVNQAAKAALDAHNVVINEALARLSFRTTAHTQLFQDNSRSGELQPLDQYARAVPRRVPLGGEYTVGLPLIGAGDAVGQVFLARLEATVQDVNDTIVDFQNSHLNWLRRQLLSAFFQNVDWAYTDRRYGTYPVVGLANGDQVRYPVTTSVGATTDNHYLAQAAAISDAANPFTTLVSEIKEHPENTGDIMVFVSAAQMPAISNLSFYYTYTDPALSVGIDTTRLTGPAPTPPFGAVMGYYTSGITRCWVVQWDALNEVGSGDYLFALPANGPRPIAQRIHDVTRLGDLGPLDTRADYPYYEQQYGVFTGFGGWNRVAGAVMRIGNATYAVPDGYERVG